MKIEEAIEIVLREARSNGIGGLADDKTHEAASVVEDFFVNNVFNGTEAYNEGYKQAEKDLIRANATWADGYEQGQKGI